MKHIFINKDSHLVKYSPTKSHFLSRYFTKTVLSEELDNNSDLPATLFDPLLKSSFSLIQAAPIIVSGVVIAGHEGTSINCYLFNRWPLWINATDDNLQLPCASMIFKINCSLVSTVTIAPTQVKVISDVRNNSYL